MKLDQPPVAIFIDDAVEALRKVFPVKSFEKIVTSKSMFEIDENPISVNGILVFPSLDHWFYFTYQAHGNGD